MRRLILLSLTAFIVGCSSAPPGEDAVFKTRNRAAEYSEYGHRYFEAGRLDKALEFYVLSLDTNLSVDNRPGVVMALNSIGKVLLVQGKVVEAGDRFSRAFQLAEAIGDPRLTAMSANHLGELLLDTGDPETAMEYFALAGEYTDELSEADRAILLHNTASVYKSRQDYTTALDLYRKALAINEKERRYEEAASNHYMIASIESLLGDFDSAMADLRMALEYDKRMENVMGIAKDLRAMGIVAEKAGDKAAAYDFLERSYSVYAVRAMSARTTVLLPDLERLAGELGLASDAEFWRSKAKLLEEER